jgi:AraC-like DNA-binding protein
MEKRSKRIYEARSQSLFLSYLIMQAEMLIPLLSPTEYNQIHFGNRSPLGTSHSNSIIPSAAAPYIEVYRRGIPGYQCKGLVPAHRRNFYILSLVTGGEARRIFNLRSYHVFPPTLVFIPPHVVTTWESLTDVQEGFICAFSAEFVRGSEVKPFVEQLPFFHFGAEPVLSLSDEQVAQAKRLFEDMEGEYVHRKPERDEILRSYLRVLLIQAKRWYATSPQPSNELPAGVQLTKRFLAILESVYQLDTPTHLRNRRSVSEYAEHLCVHPTHLNDTLKELTGKTASEHIRERLLMEAKLLLKHTALPIADIAFRLDFSEPAHFSHFFRKSTEYTPIQFRSLQG